MRIAIWLSKTLKYNLSISVSSLTCVVFRQEALAALKEAIQIAQETNDHVCLEHCLVNNIS